MNLNILLRRGYEIVLDSPSIGEWTERYSHHKHISNGY